MGATVAFFNNKGGVGKTTLACNFAAFVASPERRVLVLDLDPQCNSTQLLLDEDQWETIYEDVDTSGVKTILRPLHPIRSGDSEVDTTNLPLFRSERFGVDVLPGHPSLSIFEDILGASWALFGGGKPAGARRTAWLRALRQYLDDLYEVIVVDVSPSLGAINRSALIGADHFVTPMAADLFSLYALDNIASWFQRWLTEYDRAREASDEELLATGYDHLAPRDIPIRQGFLGYTVQQYVSRASGGDVRRVQAYDQHRDQIPEHARQLEELSEYAGSELDLGVVPNMFSMIPLAQSVHAPIVALTSADGLRGAQVSQQERYAEQLQAIFAQIDGRLTSGQI